jgi:Zn-dependent M28 family amino/carboxypeptidase
MMKISAASGEKYKQVQQMGAVGLVEILALPQAPWPGLVNYLSQPVWGIQREGESLPHVFIKPADINNLKYQEGEKIKGSLLVLGKKNISIPGKNVVALVEGTDPKFKDEYIIVTAHYDHVGVQRNAEGKDSIFNGARDNAIGTTALLETAKYLSKNPAKHPVILVALTSEEKGLLGSQWYTEHPLVPLNKTILSINCDGVGYNDKSMITSISWGRTTTDEEVTRAAKMFGLNVGGDPDPKENFFERSDQVSFARKGIPAIKLQPGLARMDDEIRKYYHRQADEVSSLDFQYLTKFYKTFVTAVQLLANRTQRPAWKPGDKFEETSRKLYSGT